MLLSQNNESFFWPFLKHVSLKSIVVENATVRAAFILIVGALLTKAHGPEFFIPNRLFPAMI
jgi:hypothetical protein